MPPFSPFFFLLGSITATLVNAQPTAKRSQPTCSDITIPVTITAENYQTPGGLLSALTNLETGSIAEELQNVLNSAGSIVQETLSTGGTYSISGRFCEPEVQVPGRSDTIQLLVHGITVDKNYWSGGGFPEGLDGDVYSWIAYASKLGFPTLSIDRLGYANSSHPDPVLEVQVPAQVEVHHDIITKLRNGDIGGRKFSKVAYIGHSFGSVLGNSHSSTYPNDVDALILTGYTKFIKPTLPGIAVTPLALPAVLVSSRYSDLDLGYMAMSYDAGRVSLLFTNDESEWPQEIIPLDRSTQDTVTVGEFISAIFSTDVANDYTGPVQVITGHKDQVFCGISLPEVTGETNCGEGDQNMIAQTGTLYPKANYSYVDIPSTGHVLNYHYTANQTFKAAHDFLKDHGF
jgi:pimeloyl-ACP methyl ester carboxylesterase